MIRRILALLVCAIACSPVPSHSAPQIFFSDLDTAPAGALVTLYGQGFEMEPGMVFFGDTPAKVYAWAPEKITVYRPDAKARGVSVRTSSSESSNSIDVAVHDGRIFYVGESGPDGEPRGKVVDSIGEFFGASKPGDVAYVRGGIHEQIGDPVYGANIFVRPRYSGTPGRPVAIVGFPGERAQIGNTNTKHAVFVFDNVENFTIANLRLTGSASAVTLSPKGVRRNIRIVGNEASGIEAYYGVFRLNSTLGLQVLGNVIEHSGVPGNKFSHLIYYGGFGPGDDVSISYNRLTEQVGGRCIQVYGHREEDWLTNLRIEFNRISGCRLDGILVGGSDEPRKREWIESASITGNSISGAGAAAVRLNDAGLQVELSANRISDSGVVLNIQSIGNMVAKDNILLARSRGSLVNVGAVGRLEVSGNCYLAGEAWDKDSDPRRCTSADTVASRGD